MDIDSIQKLIERYWDGSTSIEEEKAIEAYFDSHSNLPPELAKWKKWFVGKQAMSRAGLDSGFDNKILSDIQRSQLKAVHIRLKRFLLSSVAVAALGIFAYFSLLNSDHTVDDANKMSYAEVQESYETVKELLYFTSSKINQTQGILKEGTGKVEVINKYIK